MGPKASVSVLVPPILAVVLNAAIDRGLLSRLVYNFEEVEL